MTILYRIRSGRRIAPFMDEVPDLFVADQNIRTWIDTAAAGAGLEVVDVERAEEATERPAFALYDDMFISEMALRQFVADAQGREVRFALSDSVASRALEPLQDASRIDGGKGFDLVHLVDAKPLAREDIDARFTPLFMPTKEVATEVSLPPARVGGEGRQRQESQVAVTARVAGNVRHWLHVLRLSQLAIGVRLLDTARHTPGAFLKMRWAARKEPWAVGKAMTFVHPTARVHPSADLEAVVIGPDVVVDAHAHIRHSVIGAGAEIQDHAKLTGCTLAPGVQILRNSYFAGCAAFPEATLSNVKAQLCLFGRGAFLTSSVLLIDARLRGEVRVQHEDGFVSVGPFLGSCLGHEVTLGTGVTLEAGRALPNGITVVGRVPGYLSDPRTSSESTMFRVEDGRLVPFEETA